MGDINTLYEGVIYATGAIKFLALNDHLHDDLMQADCTSCFADLLTNIKSQVGPLRTTHLFHPASFLIFSSSFSRLYPQRWIYVWNLQASSRSLLNVSAWVSRSAALPALNLFLSSFRTCRGCYDPVLLSKYCEFVYYHDQLIDNHCDF